MLLSFLLAADLRADPSFPPEQIEFFENQVRPLLAHHCYECHSARAETIQGGLRLDARAAAISGGDSGPAVVPGKPDESLLVDAVRWKSFEMPPQGKLSETQIATLTKWVEMDAPWPDRGVESPEAGREGYDWARWRTQHWAFQPVRKPAIPDVDDASWPLSDLDPFILARLEDEGLSPAPPAEPRVLLRRLYFDLVGLPPSPQEADDFEAAAGVDRQAAVRAAVERLLDSPHYGERWGRYWLDVARYSDGYGGFLDSSALPEAWRYRDWVVQSLNEDLPFDRFVRLQIAGDLIGGRETAVATGFFALGPTYRSDGGDPDSVAQAQAETLADRVDTLGRGLLGLTLACARCHEHKFDPVPQQDYYSLAGIFNNTRIQETPLAPPEVVQAYEDHQKATAELDKRIKDLDNRIRQEQREATAEESRQLETWKNEREHLRSTAPPKYDVVHALADSGSADMNVAIRGDLRKPGDAAPRRFLRILAGDQPAPFREGSGRLGLAEAVADPRNPLTARVFVNRVWMHHFGKALARTPDNFGSLGEPPTHPELLDWLTASFVESGWSIKQLHRTIMLSATYQMSSRFDASAYAADGDNRLIWRMNSRRLDVESWRDALLTVTGELDRALGGPPDERIDSPRRTLYFKASRNGDVFATDEFLRLFDFPLMRATIATRPTSIVPQQYLFLMNSSFMLDRSRALAARLEREAETDRQRIELAYRLLYGRGPTDEEIDIGRQFVTLPPAGEQEPAAPSRWQQYAQVLLSSNEFMYVQ